MMMKLETRGEALLLGVKVVPNASRAGIAGVLGDALKIKVAQPPEDGKANRAVEALLAGVLGISPSQVTVVAGHTRPHKTVRLEGIPLEAARLKLEGAMRSRG
jgi:uncharacterized protein (TIGR00251 family)